MNIELINKFSELEGLKYEGLYLMEDSIYDMYEEDLYVFSDKSGRGYIYRECEIIHSLREGE